MNKISNLLSYATISNHDNSEKKKSHPGNQTSNSDSCIEISVIQNEESQIRNERNESDMIGIEKNKSFQVVNISDMNKEDGWYLHYKNGNNEFYYYYENGVRIKKMERLSTGEWKEYNLLDNNIYEIGCSFYNKKKYGYWLKYENGILKEENEYFNGKQKGVHKEFSGNEMKEYDLDGNLLYCGNYLIIKGRHSVRHGKGCKYRDGMIVYEGDWKYNYSDEISSVGLVLISEVATALGILFFGNLTSACLSNYPGQDIYMATCVIGIYYLVRSFFDQFQGEWSISCSGILLIYYIVLTFVFLGLALTENPLEFRYPFFGIISLIIFIVLIVYSCISVCIVGYYKEKKKGKNMFMVLSEHKGYMLIIIDLIIGCFPIILSSICFIDYRSKDDSFDYHWISLFMVFNSIMYFVISLLHSLSDSYFNYGISIGIAWGIIACVISLLIAFLTRDVYDIPISVNLTIQGWSSLMITISSLLLKCLRGKEN